MVSGGYGQVIPELIQRMKEEHFYIFGNGEQTRSFCFVEDHVKIAYILMNECKNETCIDLSIILFYACHADPTVYVLL